MKLLPLREYAGINHDDPIRLYKLPVIGNMYRKRIELCLDECIRGERVLEIGFGSGVAFLNLHDLYDEIHGLDLTSDVEAVSRVFTANGVITFLKRGNVREMPYPDDLFDTVLLISILEHLKPEEQLPAFHEIRRVLKPGGQVVYGVPVERPLMTFMFRLLGYDIRLHHFSSEKQVEEAASALLQRIRVHSMKGTPPLLGAVYEIGHFRKS